jgi:hypothetical protein
MIYEVLSAKNDELEDNFLELLATHFLPKKRKQAMVRCRVLLEMLYQTLLNLSMVQFGLNKCGVHLSDAHFAEELSGLAVGALGEYMES